MSVLRRRDHPVTRKRWALTLLVIATLGIVAASILPSTSATTLEAPTAVADPAMGRAAGSIDHIIIIVQENRSFDHYFGTFPGANGIPMRADGTPSVCIPDEVLGHCSRPYHSTSQYQQGGPHDQKAAQIDRNGGAMNGFVTSAIRSNGKCATTAYRFSAGCRAFIGPAKQPDVLSYHTG